MSAGTQGGAEPAGQAWRGGATGGARFQSPVDRLGGGAPGAPEEAERWCVGARDAQSQGYAAGETPTANMSEGDTHRLWKELGLPEGR